jgi:hypothetical protein
MNTRLILQKISKYLLGDKKPFLNQEGFLEIISGLKLIKKLHQEATVLVAILVVHLVV